MGRPALPINVSEKDRVELQRRIASGSSAQAAVARGRVILLSSEGQSVQEVRAATGLSRPAVLKWRQRFRRFGLDGLRDRPRTGRPRAITPETTKRILDLTVHRIPQESTHWSVRLMAKYAGVTVWQVRQVWAAADLKPHRLKTFKISSDPHFAEKVVDVVGLYMDPPDDAMVLSLDEKTQIQALDRTQPMLQLRPGQVARRTHDYKRHGTASLYAAFDVASGRVIGRVTKRHRAVEFLTFLGQIDRSTPAELDIHVILDNSSTHKTAEVAGWLERHPRFHVHFTPTSASWLNAVERWFGQLERRCVHRGVFTSVQDLRDELRRFIEAHNQHSAQRFVWTKPAGRILASVERAKASAH